MRLRAALFSDGILDEPSLVGAVPTEHYRLLIDTGSWPASPAA
jgi:hypothetical protein